ncbi:MAG: Spy/CpxP family protein refolding chaperone [Piscinibacter sp.]|uniref:Spy/CpxP family protein refolding chaperone n=1 Tax=Piscinibacter sp. TaxID=1903157 RepID=UPI003D13BBE2
MHAIFKTLGVVTLTAFLAACNHPYGPGGPGPGYGPGPGPGYGHGMMGGPGSGWGMGPGMMGGPYGGWGMGPGMMGGPYGGSGMGPGMMGGMWGLGRLDLSAEQRSRIDAILAEERRKHWVLMRSMPEPGETLDDKGERSRYEAMAALHRQMFESHLEARRRILEVLTPAQREQLGPRGPAR